MTDAQAVDRARQALQQAGLRASLLVRDLRSGRELGIDPDFVYPVASLVKVPLALATLERLSRGELDGAMPITLSPDGRVGGVSNGVSRFRHPATIALDDVLYLSTALSDNASADALFALTPPAAVACELRRLGLEGMTVRHTLRSLAVTPAERLEPGQAHMAHAFAIGAVTPGRGHHLPQLDISRANTGSARAFVDLLQELWRPTATSPASAATLRDLLGQNVLRQRLAPDFITDASRWSSKTGTLLNLRHEVGVVEHEDGAVLAVAVLTDSRVSASAQPAAEAAMGHAARILHDRLRS